MMVTGGELLARAMRNAQVDQVFTLHGGHLDAFFVACEPNGIRLIDTRHEATAGHAADAYARMTGQPGVCVVTSGPGFTNVYTAIANAYLDSIPVLFVVGAPPIREAETNPLQGGIDQIAASLPVTKWAHRATNTERIPELVDLALRHAVSGRPGPVLLEVPIDILFRPVDDSLIRNQTSSLGVARPGPASSQIADAIQLLESAERPILVTGGGAALSDAGFELVELAEMLVAPVFVPGKGDGILPASHPLAAGGATPLSLMSQMVGAPDVVVLIGCRVGMFTGGRASSFPGAKIIQIDLDLVEIGRLQNVAVPIVADCKMALRALIDSAQTRTFPDTREWSKNVVAVKDFHRGLFSDSTTSTGRLHPYFAAQAVVAGTPDDAVFILDGGEAPNWAEFHIQAERPSSVLRLGYLGCLGVGQGFAIGAQGVAPDRPVLLITGDGAAAFHIQEFDTMVRHGLPVVTVVFNNLVWGMSIHGQKAVYGDSGVVVSELADSAYEQVAIAFGGYGERVDRLEDLEAAVRRAFESGRPACINVAIDPEVVHPLTTAMLGDVTTTSEIVVPYYENLPL